MTGRPRLARHVRLTVDPTRDRPVLLGPETVTVLNGTGAEILRLCDGRRTVTDIVDDLGRRYAGVAEADVRAFLTAMTARRYVEVAHG